MSCVGPSGRQGARLSLFSVDWAARNQAVPAGLEPAPVCLTGSRTTVVLRDKSTSPYGFRSHLAGLKDRRHHQTPNGPRECVGQELNLHSNQRVGYGHLGSPMPSRHRIFFRSIFDIRHSLFAISSSLNAKSQYRISNIEYRSKTPHLKQVALVGVEPTASLVLSKGGLPIAYRAGSLDGWI